MSCYKGLILSHVMLKVYLLLSYKNCTWSVSVSGPSKPCQLPFEMAPMEILWKMWSTFLSFVIVLFFLDIERPLLVNTGTGFANNTGTV